MFVGIFGRAGIKTKYRNIDRSRRLGNVRDGDAFWTKAPTRDTPSHPDLIHRDTSEPRSPNLNASLAGSWAGDPDQMEDVMTKTLKYLAVTMLVSGLAACTTVNGASPKFTPGNPKFTTGISGPMPISKPVADR